jgi:hypothetical protein
MCNDPKSMIEIHQNKNFMNRQQIITVLCLGFMINLIPVIANSQGKGNHQTSHQLSVKVPAGQPAPKVKLKIYPDPMKGWNLELKINNFKFVPEKIATSAPSQVNEGHAHLLINGKKVTRLYGSWYYLKNLPVGSNEIVVTLNTNNHESLIVNGQVVGDKTQIMVK